MPFSRSQSLAALYPALAPAEMGNTKAAVAGPPKRKDAVLVLGSTGKMGRSVVKQVHPLHCHSMTASILACSVRVTRCHKTEHRC
jgi:hypothetical protein